MNRKKKTVEKRTYALKNAFPRFVSIVTRGANFTPFAELRFSEDNAKFSDVEINQIVFSKTQFNTVEDVKAYLEKNDFQEFEIKEEADTFFVPGIESDKFTDIQVVEYDDGVIYSVGKLKEPVTDAQPAAEVIESSVLATEPAQETLNVQEEVKDGQEQEQVSESEQVETTASKTGEGNVSDQSTEAGSSENQEEVAASEPSVEEVITKNAEVVTATESNPEAVLNAAEQFFHTEKFAVNNDSFRDLVDDYREDRTFVSFDTAAYLFMSACYSALEDGDLDQFKTNCNDFYGFVSALVTATKALTYSSEQVIEVEESPEVIALKAKVAELEQKIEEFSETSENTIDEEPVIIQNRQSIPQNDLTAVEEPEVKKDPTTEKFRERQLKNLLGLN